MKCPKCNSENVHIQSKEVKPNFTLPLCLVLGGFGLMFYGIGAIVGVVLGLIIGAILSAVLPSGYRTIMVCQNCGYVSQPMAQTTSGTIQHPLFCNEDDSNLTIIRNDIAKGTIVVIRIIVDNSAPFDISDNTSTYLNVPQGWHLIKYEQINGIGKKKNRGEIKIEVSGTKAITFSFTRQGLIVK